MKNRIFLLLDKNRILAMTYGFGSGGVRTYGNDYRDYGHMVRPVR